MKRWNLAAALAFGLAAAGCSPTADEAANNDPLVPAPGSDTLVPKDAATGAAPGGASGAGGPPPNVMQGMQSDAYRKAAGVADPKPAETPKEGDAAPAPAPTPDAKPEGDAAPATAPEKKDEPKTDGGIVLSDEEIKAINELPDAEDRKLALAQKICAVGEDEGKPQHLGAMGMPVKQVVKGTTLFLCCEGCLDGLKADPDKALAKIKK